MGTYNDLLRSGQKRIGIWGVGYIGYSSMAHLARSGVRCLGYDIDREKLDKVRSGVSAIPNMEYWLGFDTGQLVRAGLMEVTDRWEDLITPDILVHLICVPTEQGARPYDKPLRQVMEHLAGYASRPPRPLPLIIIESTIAPNVVDEVVVPILEGAGLSVGKDLLLGVAPRRDWFISPDKTLRTIPRVVGGTTPAATEHMQDVLGLVCDTVLPAPDHRHAALVKSIENAYRQVEIALANQLSRAYPDLDMREILRLVGTKWNIGTYHPSFGTGGYCIPLAPHYVLDGAPHPAELSILHASIASENEMPQVVARSVIEKFHPQKVGIAGLAYKGDIKVAVLSPTIRLVQEFREHGVDVKVNDPYYTPEEIQRIAGVDAFEFPDGLAEFDTVMLVADHLLYRAIPVERLREHLHACRVIIDNTGLWESLRLDGIEYYLAGAKGWIHTPKAGH